MEKFRVDAAGFFGNGVTGKNDDGIAALADFVELLEQLADVVVETRNHGGTIFLRLRPRFFRKGSVGGHHTVAVTRDGATEHEEKRAIMVEYVWSMFIYKRPGEGDEPVGNVLDLLAVGIGVNLFRTIKKLQIVVDGVAFIAPDGLGIGIGRIGGREIAGKFIEAFKPGRTAGTFTA